MTAADAGHLGQLTLRQLFAGELPGAQASAAKSHAEACEQCRAGLRAIEDEQRRFESTIDFEAFAAGVERAARHQSRTAAPAAARPRLQRWVGPVASLAAVLIAVVFLGPVLRQQQGAPRNHVKGGAGMDLVIKGSANGPQRVAGADVPAILAPGERVRIGYQAGALGYVAAVSVDEHGEVTPLYPATGQSSKAEPGEATHYLPDAWEFTGKGMETVVVVLTDRPLQIEALTRAAHQAYLDSRGDLSKLDRLPLPGLEGAAGSADDAAPLHGEQFHRTLLKP